MLGALGHFFYVQILFSLPFYITGVKQEIESTDQLFELDALCIFLCLRLNSGVFVPIASIEPRSSTKNWILKKEFNSRWFISWGLIN